MSTFSIELAHLLLAAASEVDVVAKLLCEKLDPTAPRSNIDHYRSVLTNHLEDLPSFQVYVPRYGLTLTPWDNWETNRSPNWWRSYNNVKHERGSHFNEATLKNALNALAALHVLIYYYYSYLLSESPGEPLAPKETTKRLLPEPTLMFLHEDFYFAHLIA